MKKQRWEGKFEGNYDRKGCMKDVQYVREWDRIQL
jgi:hypothetical protein